MKIPITDNYDEAFYIEETILVQRDTTAAESLSDTDSCGQNSDNLNSSIDFNGFGILYANQQSMEAEIKNMKSILTAIEKSMMDTYETESNLFAEFPITTKTALVEFNVKLRDTKYKYLLASVLCALIVVNSYVQSNVNNIIYKLFSDDLL